MSEADFEVTFYAECYKEKRRALQICLTSLHMAKKLGNHDCAFNGVAKIFVFFALSNSCSPFPSLLFPGYRNLLYSIVVISI